MDSRKFKFLKAVLGEDGARALAKAAERGPELENALLPRTIMAWLGIAGRSDFEGQIPGVENTYLQFGKAEDRYSGSVAVGDEVYSFESATMLHLGACVAVALGADHERVSPGLRDLEIQRLGKNIDTLVKARIAVAELRKMRIEGNSLRKAIGAIQPGKDMLNGTHDYSHVLAPEHRAAGYQLHVSPVMVGQHPAGVRTNLMHQGNFVGQVVASHDPDDHSISVADANISEGHRGRGLGTHMYEAAMAHSFHHFGASSMQGGSHSTAASKVHQALSAKHGLGYQAQQKASAADRPDGDYDAKLGGYSYAIKAEMEMSKAAMKPGGGVEAPGPAAAPRPPDAPQAPLAAVPTQTSKGPTVGLHPKPPKLPTPKASTDQVQTGPGMGAPKAPKAKSPTLKVTKAQSEVECGVCGGHQFQGPKFTGCLCFQDLAKAVRVTVLDDGYNLEFKADWDQDSILTLLESLGRK
jgi:hypothetical protein